MADHQVVCTRKAAPTALGHQHVVSVGIGAGSAYREMYIVEEVYRMMHSGHRFYTVSPVDGRVSYIRAVYCCGINTLATSPAGADELDYLDYLDNLGPCG